VAGDREAESHTLAVRTQSGQDLGVKSPEEVAALIRSDAASRGQLSLG